MAEVKKQPETENKDSNADDGLLNFYFPDANEGMGGTVRAADRESADKLAKAGKFYNATNEAPADAGEDKAA